MRFSYVIHKVCLLCIFFVASTSWGTQNLYFDLPENNINYPKKGKEGSFFRFSYFHLGNISLKGIQEGDGSYGSYNSIAASRKLETGNRVSIAGAFAMSSAGKDTYSNDKVEPFELEPLYIYTQYQLQKRGVGAKLQWAPALRFYFPLSKHSKTSGEIFTVEGKFSLRRPLTYRQWLRWFSNVKYSVHTHDGYRGQWGHVRGTNYLSERHSFRWDYYLSTHWSFSASQTWKRKHYRSVENFDKPKVLRDSFSPELSLNYGFYPLFAGIGVSTESSRFLEIMSENPESRQLNFQMSYLF